MSEKYRNNLIIYFMDIWTNSDQVTAGQVFYLFKINDHVNVEKYKNII